MRMQLSKFVLVVCVVLMLPTLSFAQKVEWTPARICQEIDKVAKAYNLPRATFTRLIWTESRFDIRALSPKGAQGIAQFMPATAKSRGLANAYDPAQALPASASLLADLTKAFGNFGLAAMAYNAGPGRVERWLKGTSRLPFETQDYVAAVTGQSAEVFRNAKVQVRDFSLRKGKSFQESCPRLRVIKTRFKGVIPGGGVAAVARKPWGVQVAGHFSRRVALRSWTRVRGKLGVVIGNAKPHMYRQRSLRGMKAKWAVRIGADSRKKAIAICKKIRSVGGFCLVKRN